MAIVISSNVRLVVSTTDTTTINNNTTELAILKGITIQGGTQYSSYSRSGVSNENGRAVHSVVDGKSDVTLTFKTHVKSAVDTNVTHPEKLLWESLTSTDVVETPTSSSVTFTSNTNQLRELYFYIIFDDGTYYKVSKGVVASADIGLDLKTLTTITWTIKALSYSYNGANLVGADPSVSFIEASPNFANSIMLGEFLFNDTRKESWHIAPDGSFLSVVTYGTLHDISTINTTAAFKFLAGLILIRGMELSADGTKLWVGNNQDQLVKFVPLSEPYDYTTIGFPSATTFNPAEMTLIYGVKTNSDDSKMFLMDQNYTIYQYTMNTPGDIATMSYDGVSLSISDMPQTTSRQYFSFTPDGSRLIVYGVGILGIDSLYRVQVYSLVDYDITNASLLVTYDFTDGTTVPAGIAGLIEGGTLNLYGAQREPFTGVNRLLKHTVVEGGGGGLIAPKTFQDVEYLATKLSSLDITYNGSSITAALVKGQLTITNTVQTVARTKIGQLRVPSNHYVRDRQITCQLSVYLNNDTDHSSTIPTHILNSTTLEDLNSTNQVILHLGGQTGRGRLQVTIPAAKISLLNTTVGYINLVDINVIPTESVQGSGDEISITYF